MPKETASTTSYSLPQRLLHWLTALFVFYNLLLPDGMSEWHRAVEHGAATNAQLASANIHAYVGIAIFLLVGVRLFLRFIQGAPSTPIEERAVFGVVAKATHAALYLLLVAIPVTGIAAFYLGYDGAGDVHADVLKVILWALIAAHVLGAVAHQFYWKTNVIKRMTIG